MTDAVCLEPNASPAALMFMQMLMRTRQEGSSAKSLNMGTTTEGIFYQFQGSLFQKKKISYILAHSFGKSKEILNCESLHEVLRVSDD